MTAASSMTPPSPPGSAKGRRDEVCLHCLHGAGSGAGAAVDRSLPRQRGPMRRGRCHTGSVDAGAVCRRRRPCFCGAVGIAVRAIAPCCRSKAADPAVVVLDEGGQFAIPLLSGHLGGANELARRLAAVCRAVPVITTATDGRGLFAVDEWARCHRFAVAEPERIKTVSSALLAGQTVHYASDWAIAGPPPAGVCPACDGDEADFALTLTPAGRALHLIPRIAVLGGSAAGAASRNKGLRRRSARSAPRRIFAAQGVCRVASIDLKRTRPGWRPSALPTAGGWIFYTAEQLRAVSGSFTPSPFVQSVTGVDNVCERAAVLASGGVLYLPKWARDGVTFAVAVPSFAPDWRWKNEP